MTEIYETEMHETSKKTALIEQILLARGTPCHV